MIFLDTSGIYALADRDDEKHEEAARMLAAAQRNGVQFLTHSYVIVESAALIQRRLGLKPALDFLDDSRNFTVRWVTSEMHIQGVRLLKEKNSSKLSLVDAVSFVVMSGESVTEYLGFDQHFANEGFQAMRVEEA